MRKVTPIYIIIGIACAWLSPCLGQAQVTELDSLIHQYEVRDSKNIVQRMYDYFFRNNAPDDSTFSLGILPGPHYSSTSGLGIGIMATGVYRCDRHDKTLPQSNVSLMGDITTKGYLTFGAFGTTVFPRERYRLDFRVKGQLYPTQYWGIGFDQNDDDASQTDYHLQQVTGYVRFGWRVATGTFVGPMLRYQYSMARHIRPALPDAPDRFAGQPHKTSALTLGLSLTYDSRDFMLCASRGCFLQVDQTFTPRFLAGEHCFSSTEVTFSTYHGLWQGATLAAEMHALFNYGNPAWSQMAEAGTTHRLRGYYEGRYRDKHLMEAQMELRQHIAGRHGAVAWVGVGEVFPDFSGLRFQRLLPNAGIGYRWEFKHRVNVRIDYGFTRNGGGLIFNVNEAF